jgi:hypothetical protein
MHLREVIAAGGGTLTDTMHIAFAIGTVLLMILIIGFAAAALGKRFRLYSFLTIIIFMVFGFLTARESPGISSNLPTPWIGIWERINIGMFLLWVIRFAIAVLRMTKDKFPTKLDRPDGAPLSRQSHDIMLPSSHAPATITSKKF